MATDVLMCEAGRDLLYADSGKRPLELWYSRVTARYATADFEFLKVRT